MDDDQHETENARDIDELRQLERFCLAQAEVSVHLDFTQRSCPPASLGR